MKKVAITILLVGCLSLIGVTSALAEFDWKAHSGTDIKLLLNKHPYTDALLAHLAEFTEKTGIQVTFDVFPEDEYFDKVTVSLSSKSPEYSVFMTGAYQVWQYAPPGFMADLKPYMADPEKTGPEWDQEDIYKNLLDSLAWNLKPGDPLGTEDAKQWALPWGFETNTMIYRKDIFDKHGLTPPKDMPELLELCAKLKELEPDMYPIAVRGTRSWARFIRDFYRHLTGSEPKTTIPSRNPP